MLKKKSTLLLLAMLAFGWSGHSPLAASDDPWETCISTAHECPERSGKIKSLREALKIAEAFGNGDPRLTATLRLLSVQVPSREAIALLAREQQILEEQLGTEFPGLTAGLLAEAELLIANCQPSEALKLLKKAAKIHPAWGRTNWGVSISILEGSCNWQLGQDEAAIRFYKNALNKGLLRNVFAPDLRNACHSLAQLCESKALFADAEEALKNSLVLCSGNRKPVDSDFLEIEDEILLADLHVKKGLQAQASKEYKQCFLQLKKLQKKTPCGFGYLLEARLAERQSKYSEALDLLAKTGGVNELQSLDCSILSATIKMKQGDKGSAFALCKNGLEAASDCRQDPTGRIVKLKKLQFNTAG